MSALASDEHLLVANQRIVYSRSFMESLRDTQPDPLLKRVVENFVLREMDIPSDLVILNPELSTFAYKSSLDGSNRANRQNRLSGHGNGPKQNRREKQKIPESANHIKTGYGLPKPHIEGPLTFESLPQGFPFSGAFSDNSSFFSHSFFQNFNFGSVWSASSGLAPPKRESAFLAENSIPLLHAEISEGSVPSKALDLGTLLLSTKIPASVEKENLRENMTPPKATRKKPLSATLSGQGKSQSSMSTSAPPFAPTSASQKSHPKKIESKSKEKKIDFKAEQELPETVVARMVSREKQIQYGYNTVGYQLYVASIPKSKRSRDMPRTPDKNQQCSKRSWDGQVRKWRRALHQWDPVELKEEWMTKQQVAEQEDENVKDMVEKLLFDEDDGAKAAIGSK